MDACSKEPPGPDISRRVIGAFYETYNELGVGFLEAVYENDAQILDYLKATGVRLGLLLNFGPKAQIRRRVY